MLAQVFCCAILLFMGGALGAAVDEGGGKMEFNLHKAKMELIGMQNDGLLTTQEMCIAWDLVDDAEQDLADAATDARIDANMAEFDFRMYCAEVPGAHAEKILAAMGATPEHSKRYWKRALASARLAHAAWLVA